MRPGTALRRRSALLAALAAAAAACDLVAGFESIPKPRPITGDGGVGGVGGADSPTSGTGPNGGSGGSSGGSSGDGGSGGDNGGPRYQCLWAKSIGSDAGQDLGGVAVAVTDVVLTGSFKGALQVGGVGLDLGGGTTDDDAFVARLNGASGETVWARAYGDDREQLGIAVVPGDINTSGLFVTGSFEGTVNFGCAGLTAVDGGKDTFVARLTPDGSCIWSMGFNFTDTDLPSSITFDTATRMAVVTGTINSHHALYVNAYGVESGSLLHNDWFTPPVDFDLYGLDIFPLAASSRNGRTFIGGRYDGKADLGKQTPRIIESYSGDGAPDAFAVAYQNDRLGGGPAMVWSDGYGTAGSQAITGMDVFSSGGEDALFFIGTFDGTLDLKGGPVLAASGGSNAFLARRKAADGAHGFAEHFVGANVDAEALVAQPSSNSLLVAGRFEDVVELAGHRLRKPNGAVDSLFLARFDAADGHHLWSAVAGGPTGIHKVKSMALAGNDVILAGTYTGELDLAGCPSLVNDGTGGVPRIFVARLQLLP